MPIQPDLNELAHYHEMPIITVPAAFCLVHWREYVNRVEPSRSAVVMTFKLWEALMQDEPFVRAIGAWREPPEPWEMPTDCSLLNETMRAEPYAPWCCYLGPERREQAWEQTPMSGTEGQS